MKWTPEHFLLALAIVVSAATVCILSLWGHGDWIVSLVAALGGVTGLRALVKPSPSDPNIIPPSRFTVADPFQAPSEAQAEPERDTMTTPAQFAQALLHALALPISDNNVQALVAAQAIEGGFMHNAALYNPLNTTWKSPGSRAVTPVGVQAYVNWEQGLDATVRTLKNGLYNGILSSLAASAPPDTTLVAMALSPWGWYHIENGQKVPNPIGKASTYQFYANKVFPSGGGGLGGLAGAGVGGVGVGVLLLGLAGAAYAYATGKI